MIIAVGIVLLFQLHQSGKIKEVKKSETKIYDFNIKASELVTLKEFNKKYEVKNVKVDGVKPKRPYIKGLPKNISEATLDHIWLKCESIDFSYELFLGILMLESEQGTKKIHYNEDGSVDRGIMMINSKSIKSLAKNAGMNDYDPFNNFDSINLAIEHLKEDRDYWTSIGMSDEESFPYVIVTYNRGLGGTKEYLKHHDIWDNKYLQVVRHYKTTFEKSENGGN
jgi:hypothetical protein